MVSTASTGQAFQFVDNKPIVVSDPIGWEIAQCHLCQKVSKIGMNEDIDNAWEDLWSVGGQYIFPTSGIRMEVVSNSALDNASNTGARTAQINYLTSDFTAYSTTVNLNGITAVETSASNIYRINNFWVLTAGTANAAVGTIDVRSTADTPIYTRILPNQTRARNTCYTVPKDKDFYITQVSYSAGNVTGNAFVRFQLQSNYNQLSSEVDADVFWPYSEISVGVGSFTIPYQIPMQFRAGSDIKVRAIGDTVNVNAICNCLYRGG